MNEKARLQGFDLSGKSAVIVGCGGLGTNAAVHLAGMGIGSLTLIDGDTVETRNLNRQFFYTPADTGRAKCDVLAERLRAYASDCDVVGLQKQIGSPDDLKPAGDADVLICAVDNMPARRILNDFCKTVSVPLINGGVNGLFGTAYAFLPGRTPDLEQAGLLDAENSRNTSVSSTVGVIGALQAQLAAQILCGDTRCAGRLYVFDDHEIHAIAIR